MKFVLLNIVILISTLSFAQVNKESEIYQTLKMNDSLIFEAGLNKCNLELIASLVTEDLEFYHDKGGITLDKASFIDQVKNYPCKTGRLENKRFLVKNSLEVYPLYDDGDLYGAVQIGEHMFAETRAKFNHLWLLIDGNFKLARVLSFNH